MEHIEQGDCAQNSCCDDFDNVDFCDMYSSVSRNSSVDVAIFSKESQLLMMTTKMIREVYTSLLNMIVTLVVYRHHLLLIMMPTTIIILTSPKEPLGANELGKSAPWQLGQHVPVEEHS